VPLEDRVGVIAKARLERIDFSTPQRLNFPLPFPLFSVSVKHLQ
jgi:hypothetical protein